MARSPSRPVDTWSRRDEIPIHEGGLIGDLIAEQAPAIQTVVVIHSTAIGA